MTFNTAAFNQSEYNATGPTIVGTLSGTIMSVDQSVTESLSGTVMSFDQEVELRETLSGTIMSVDQNVQAILSGTVMEIGQIVQNASTSSNLLTRKRCILDIFIGGLQISLDNVAGMQEFEYSEGEAAVCRITLQPELGQQDIEQYFGKTLKVIGRDVNNNAYQIFKGVIDIVDLDVINWRTSLQATDRRTETINNYSNDIEKLINVPYNTDLLIPDKDKKTNAELAEELMNFKDASLDLDNYGNLKVTSWTPKGTADHVLTDSDTLREKPSIRLVERGRVVNKVNLEVNYQYKRLHYVETSYSATCMPWMTNGVPSVTLGYSLVKKATVIAAVQGTGWKTKNGITFTDLPSGGYYGGFIWVGDVQQSNASLTGTSDSSGNGVVSLSGIGDYMAPGNTGQHCLGAGWDLTNRFSQQATKKYSLTVQSTTSQSVYGSIEESLSYTIDDEYDTSRWDTYEGYAPSFEVDKNTTISLTSNTSYDVNRKEPKARENIKAAMEKARVQILKTHRENVISLKLVDFRPDITVQDTVRFNNTGIDAKGKVSRVVHSIDATNGFQYTQVEISCYFLGSGGSTSSYSLPTITSSNKGAAVTSSISLGASFGVDPGTNPRAGFWGNKNSVTSLTRTNYPEMMIVDSPAIPSALTNGMEYTGSSTYTVEIPSRTLTFTYDKSI